MTLRFRLFQFVSGSALNHLHTVVSKALNEFLEVELLRLALIECQKVSAKRHLETRALVKHLQYCLGLGPPLEFNNESYPITVGLITDIRDILCPAGLGHLGDLLDHSRLGNRVRQFGYHQLLSATSQSLLDHTGTH